MNALQRLVELGEANKYDEMSTAEFVIYTEWITGGKVYNNFLDEAAAEVADMHRLTEAARAYLENSFASDRRKMQDALRDYDYHQAVVPDEAE